MRPSMTRGPDGPRKYAHNVDAAREREMHLCDSLVLSFDCYCDSPIAKGTSRTGATRHQKSLLKNHPAMGQMHRATMF